jgi:hypothetical protein
MILAYQALTSPITLSFMLKRVANPSELYFANTDFKKNEKEVILTDG